MENDFKSQMERLHREMAEQRSKFDQQLQEMREDTRKQMQGLNYKQPDIDKEIPKQLPQGTDFLNLADNLFRKKPETSFESHPYFPPQNESDIQHKSDFASLVQN